MGDSVKESLLGEALSLIAFDMGYLGVYRLFKMCLRLLS